MQLKTCDEFVPISELMQRRKDKINSKDFTERFLFSLFDSSGVKGSDRRAFILILDSILVYAT